MPLTWRTLQSYVHDVSKARPLRGGLCNHFGKLIPCHATLGRKDKLAPYVEDFTTTLGSLFRYSTTHGWDGNSEMPLSKRAYRDFAHGETALASRTGKPWTKFPDVPETGNVRDNNNNNNNKRRGLGQGRAPPLLAQNAHRVADKTVSSIIYLV